MSSHRGPQADGAATTVNTVSLMAEGLRNLTTKANAPAKKGLRSSLMLPIQSQGGGGIRILSCAQMAKSLKYMGNLTEDHLREWEMRT